VNKGNDFKHRESGNLKGLKTLAKLTGVSKTHAKNKGVSKGKGGRSMKTGIILVAGVYWEKSVQNVRGKWFVVGGWRGFGAEVI